MPWKAFRASPILPVLNAEAVQRPTLPPSLKSKQYQKTIAKNSLMTLI
jgi:hypothetical protein